MSTPPARLTPSKVGLQLPSTPLVKNVAPSKMQPNEQQIIAQLQSELTQALRERDQARNNLAQVRDKLAQTEMQWDYCRQTVHRQGDFLQARDETIVELNKKLEDADADYMCSQDAHLSETMEAEKITRELATENRDYFHRQEMLMNQLAMACQDAANAREELKKQRSLSRNPTSGASNSDILGSDNVNSIHGASLPYRPQNNTTPESTMSTEENAEGHFVQTLKDRGVCPRYYFKGQCRNIRMCKYSEHKRPGPI